jgi:hypothetical protein
LGYNHVFLINQRVDKMGQMLKEHDWRNYHERAQEGCTTFYYYSRNSISKMVFQSKEKNHRKEENEWAAIGGEEERDFKGEVHKKQETSKPFICFS